MMGSRLSTSPVKDLAPGSDFEKLRGWGTAVLFTCVLSLPRLVDELCATGVDRPACRSPRLCLQTPSGQRRVSSSGSPVSSRLFRLDKIAGQPPDVASISFESGLSISWRRVSFTQSPCGSSS